MSYWIFKVADQELYPDVPGENYVYDNTHSVRVARGDVFLYLDKRKGYAFTATGAVRRVSERTPTQREAERTSAVRRIFTAHLEDVIWFKEPLSISPPTKQGKRNRARLGIVDVNLLGWSQSMPRLNEPMYQAILDLADADNLIPPPSNDEVDFSVPDNWAKTKIRGAVKRFSVPVLARSNSVCIVCGTSLEGVVEAAHLSPYATDPSNRANPANGVCLCTYCHRALDLRIIAIRPDGNLLVAPHLADVVAKHHFSQLSSKARAQWLTGVDARFLEMTVKWFEANLQKYS